MKFVDYEASHITPQMTLLKKFNEVLKYLREIDIIKTTLYLHEITYDYHGGTKAYFLSTSGENFKTLYAPTDESVSEIIPNIIFNIGRISYSCAVILKSLSPGYGLQIKDFLANENYAILLDEVTEF